MQLIEPLPSSQAQQLGPLFEAVWPEQDFHAADIHWAFQSSPLGAGIVLVTRAENVAMPTGTRGSIPWPLRLSNGLSPVIHQLHGTCVHPDYRRLGLFTQLNNSFLHQFAASGGTAVFNVSVAASRAGYEKLGWAYLPGLRRYIYVTQPVAFVKAILKNRGRLRTTLETIHRSNDSLTPWSDLYELAQIREQVLANTHHTVPNEEWLIWRYSRENHGYRYVYQKKTGWCSYRLRRSAQITEALLGDVWLANGTATNIRRLLAVVTEAEKPTLISVLLSQGHPWHQVFRQAGFFPDWKGNLNFGVKVINEAVHDLLDSSRWALMTADIDTF